MIFLDDDDSDKSTNSVLYNNSYDPLTDSIYLDYLNSNEKDYFSSATNSRNTSYNTSRDVSRDVSRENSYKSQSYFDSIKIKKDIESRDNSYKSDNFIENIRYDKFKRIQKKNSKLKYKIVLQELLINTTKNLLYRSNYNIVLKELENKELKKYYELGVIYKCLIKSLDEGVKPVFVNREKSIQMAKHLIQTLNEKGNHNAANGIEKYYKDKYGEDFKNDTKK